MYIHIYLKKSNTVTNTKKAKVKECHTLLYCFFKLIVISIGISYNAGHFNLKIKNVISMGSKNPCSSIGDTKSSIIIDMSACKGVHLDFISIHKAVKVLKTTVNWH